MTEKTRKTLVMSTLPLALVWAAFNLDIGGKKTPQDVPQYETIQPIQAVPGATAQAHDPRLIDVEEMQKADWGQDPFRCYRYGRTTHQQPGSNLAWVLGGIIYSADYPMAFVNKKSVKVGDSVDGATVVAIDNDSVTLNYKGRTITLKVDKG